jgi:hypothetical protein
MVRQPIERGSPRAYCDALKAALIEDVSQELPADRIIVDDEDGTV